MDIEDILEAHLQDLAIGKVTVARVIAWIGEHYIPIPLMDMPEVPEIPDVDLDGEE